MKENSHSKQQYFAYRSFWPEFETVERFAKAGINTICLFPANTLNSLGEPYCKYPPNWLWFDNYDFSIIDQQINDMLAVNPHAEFLCMVDLNSPTWLSRQLSLRREDGADSFTQLSQALCNPEWRKHTSNYLKNFLAHCEKHHSKIIKSYILACGHTDEWFDYTEGAAGPAKAAAYQEWRKQHALPNGDIPSATKLTEADFDGLLLDPSVSRAKMEYWRFTNEAVSHAIGDFAFAARNIVRADAEIGVFYGYVIDRVGAVSSGHADYEYLLKCQDIDYLISPGTYRDREIGGGSGFQTIAGSERLAGKRHMHECDQRTHTYNRKLSEHVKLEFPCWQDTASDISGIKREFALTLISESSLWWFDMWGGFYQEPELMRTMENIKKLWDRLSEKSYNPIAEVAMIVDPDCLYYLDQRSPRQAHFITNARKQLNRLGAPFETYSLNDISYIPELDRYKLLIFPLPLEITPEKESLLRRYILNNDRTILFLYAPGISDGLTLNTDRVESWAGVKFGTDGLNVTNMGEWTAAYLHDPAALTSEILRALGNSAGIHFYCDLDLPVYANSRLLAIHNASRGRLKLELPERYKRITELFSNRIVAENTDSFNWDFTTPDTVLFELEK